jgi:hypothetical protein
MIALTSRPDPGCARGSCAAVCACQSWTRHQLIFLLYIINPPHSVCINFLLYLPDNASPVTKHFIACALVFIQCVSGGLRRKVSCNNHKRFVNNYNEFFLIKCIPSIYYLQICGKLRTVGVYNICIFIKKKFKILYNF